MFWYKIHFSMSQCVKYECAISITTSLFQMKESGGGGGGGLNIKMPSY